MAAGLPTGRARSELARWLREAERWLAGIARANGDGWTVTSRRRSRTTQQRLYRLRLAGKWPYPVAPPGTSKHEYGLAFDAVVTPRSRQSYYGRLFEQLGGRWGERFGDDIHFEV